MAIDRDAIVDAVLARLDEKCDFVTADRKVRHWSDVAAAEQPALFVTLGRQAPGYETRGAPAVWTVIAVAYVYTTRRQDAGASMTLGTALDSVERALELQPGEAPSSGAYLGGPGISSQTTLGGSVLYARIVGEVDTDEGLLGDQQVAVVNIEVKVSA